MRKSNRKGFTIVELVIVIAVIAILAAVLIPTFASIVKKANDSNVQQVLAAARKVAVAENATDAEFDEDTLYYYYDGKCYTFSDGKFVEDTTFTANATEDIFYADAAADAQTATGVAAAPAGDYFVANEDLKEVVVVKDVDTPAPAEPAEPTA